ncbi:hypothetical protein U9R90_27655 [Streptomyces sp. E11-3]|uniref:hypothetical protein n=1 Tax=Streptomyces sp. E11-3 TaxID=3110112 RepID=UPI0039810627
MTSRVVPAIRAQAPPPPGRLRAAWAAAHAPVAGVQRWARIAAYTVPFTVLPSSLWRLGIIFDEGAASRSGDLPSWLPIQAYVVLLSVFSEVVAFAAIGLIAAWGEVFPRWVPVLRGRRVPTAAAVVPAAFGAVLLTALWTAGFAAHAAGLTLTGEPTPSDFPSAVGGWEAAVFYASYLPLLLWGPLLGVVTVAYARRRRRAGQPAVRQGGGRPAGTGPS